MIKMIVFDLDGTLLNSKEEVTNENKNYLRKLKQQGYVLVVATGRTYSRALQALKDFSFLNYIITDTGSSIYDVSSNKAIYQKTISKKFLKYVIRDYNQNYDYIDICNKNHIYKYSETIDDNKIVINTKNIPFIMKNCKDISHITISLKQQDLVYSLYEKLKREKKTLEYLLMQDSFSEKKWIEIFPKGCSKYNAIKKLAKFLKIENEEIICFGDGLNDIEMLKKLNNGVAMKNALPEVKKVSKDVTKFDNDHDGIIKYLREKLSCKMNIVDINSIDVSNCYLHYTNVQNLESIIHNGLLPNIGINAKVIEKSKKIFFSMGETGALVIMDSWIKWLIAKPKSNFIYWIGAYLLKMKYFPKIIHKIIISYNKKSKNKIEWAYKELKQILDNSVYLLLDLKEDVDFSFNDLDEVKAYSNYPKSYIKSFYAYDSDPKDSKMEYWNMHTFSNKVIEPNKISLLNYNKDYRASSILKYLIEKNMFFVKEHCENLYQYYTFIDKNN